MIRSRVFLILLLFPLFIFSQQIDSTYVYLKNKKAISLNREGKFVEANNLLDELILNLKNINTDSKYLSISFQTKAKVLKNLGMYQESIDFARKSIQLSQKSKDSFNIADNYNTIGVNHYFLSDYDSTKIYYEKSYEIKKISKAEKRELAVSAYNLGIVYEDLAQPEKALELYHDAEKNLLADHYENTFLSDVYIGLAHLYFYQMDIDKASEYAERAMDVGLKSYGEFNPNMTFVYTSYANILENEGKYKESIELLKKALRIREGTYGPNHEWTCESNYDLGNAYLLDEQFNNAEFHYEKAITIGQKNKGKKNLFYAKTYLANFYVDQNKNLDNAEQLLTDVLKYNISVYGNKYELVAENYNYLAKIAKIRNQESKFFQYINQGLESSNYSSPELNKVIAPFEALDSFILKADWLQREYNRSKDLNFLKKKFELIDEVIALIKFTQKNFSSDRSRINFANKYREVFEDGLNTCWALYHKTNKESKYLDKAFELSETNRNTSLLEGIQNEQFKKYANIPKELLDFEREIKQKLAQIKLDLYYEKTSSDPDKKLLSDLLNQRILLSTKLDSLLLSFDQKYPKYKNLKYQNHIIKPKDIQNKLDIDSQLITYFLGEKNLYTFNITKEGITFLKGKVVESVISEIGNLKKELLNQRNIEGSSKKLYWYLLSQQVELSKSNMIIIPDNVLNYIPFEILQNDENISLMEKFTISYSGSAKLYLELNNDFFTYNTPNYWLGFAPDYNQNSKLSSINDEVKIISDLFDGSTFVGEESKKQNFFTNNKKYSVLHFAMHAKIDNKNPMNNRLIFNDGELTSSEIYVSDIKANLAVLSACNTGFGKLEKGEGVMSMARAFNYSGVPSVIMSLWKVPDKETKMIMVSFYKHLKKGKSKSEALCDAKKDYLKSVNDEYLKHPYFWSGFIVSGNTSKLTPPQNKNYYFISGILIFGLIFFGLKTRRDKLN